ncbi:hypothetical protein GH714_041682 [Hevea brasiliensis]|uniref:Uncharacterized protein n=1 Tax=Hevea brasiliensis TaxID=3981 RepID=A0A6A6MRC3_HEVBR|nr:hypothetical protein GH714_041682 [Hevea brasiliensis]
MQDPGSTVSFCLSFNSYSSDQLACIAAKVGEEEANNGAPVSRNQNENESSGSYGDVDDDDFEFVLVRSNPDACTTIDGDHEVAFPIFPLFDRDLLLSCGNESNKQSRDHEEVTSSAVRLPLKNLFIDDRDPPSSSSSEADELDRVSQGTFCVWTQQRSSPSPSPSPSPSLSASPSQSSSDGGKESLIFLNPDHRRDNNNNNNIILGRKKEEKVDKGKIIAAKPGKAKEKVSAHEVFYVRNKALKEGDKRKSYLPYRQGLVGFFANLNGLGRNFP